MAWDTHLSKDDLTQQIDYVGGTNVIYLGEAIKGASTSDSVWRIKKFSYDGNGNVLTTLLSPNYSTFGDIWTSRAGYSYT